MNLILLAGNSLNNKVWIEEVEQSLKPYFAKTIVQYYKHWSSGNNLINLTDELKILSKTTETLINYTILAKSVGVVLTAKGIFESVVKPKKCVFIGTPALWAKEKNFELNKWIQGLNTPTLFIQQKQDPAMPASKLRKYLKKYRVSNYKFIEIPGESHHYPNLEQIETLVTEFVRETNIQT